MNTQLIPFFCFFLILMGVVAIIFCISTRKERYHKRKNRRYRKRKTRRNRKRKKGCAPLAWNNCLGR